MNSGYLKGLIIVRVYRLVMVLFNYVLLGLNGPFKSSLSQKKVGWGRRAFEKCVKEIISLHMVTWDN